MTNKCCTVDNGHRKSSDAAVFSFFFTLKIWKITDLSSHIFSYWIMSVKSQCLNRAFVCFLHFLPVENILQFQGVLILKEVDKHFFWPRTWKSGILFKILFRKDPQYKTLQITSIKDCSTVHGKRNDPAQHLFQQWVSKLFAKTSTSSMIVQLQHSPHDWLWQLFEALNLSTCCSRKYREQHVRRKAAAPVLPHHILQRMCSEMVLSRRSPTFKQCIFMLQAFFSRVWHDHCEIFWQNWLLWAVY